MQLSRLWLWLSVTAAVLAAAGSVAGLAVPGSIYHQETAVLADASTAQDIVNLFLVAPLTAVLGVLASRGSLRAYLCWLGFVAFTVYNYAIYAFSIHFGPLFLVWVAVLGLSLFAMIGGLATLDTASVKEHFRDRGEPLPAWFLIVVAALFAVLWLSEIVPDLLAGNPSTSATEWKVPTSPVHVLDLAFFLPAALASGVLLLRRHPVGYATAPAQLSWVVLTCLPILVGPFVADSRGHKPGWTVMAPLGVLFVIALMALVLLLRSARVSPAAGAVEVR
ncbi:hypothetical protein [Kribbella soli]|uniref:Uncharacterized protein n=1 Tax=Kribbella soli TaxID=1124743 RepID=A0A4R0HBR3_9ACTN|nr:hypothetical protein [Kribbella soli]TCC08505.1 hypothetical protein E0H45_21775 [Kribbella soli]